MLTYGTVNPLVQRRRRHVARLLLVAVWATLGTLGGQLRAEQEIPLRFTFKTKGNSAGCMAISPDGRTLAYADTDGGRSLFRGVHLIDLATGKERPYQEYPSGSYSRVQCLTFSPDGKTLALAGDVFSDHGGTIWLFDLATRKETFKHDTGWDSTSALAFAPDGKTLAVGGGGKEVWLLDVEKRKTRTRLQGLGSEALGLAFSPDGKRLATSTLSGDTIFLWDTATGKESFRYEMPSEVSCHIAFSPDGKTLAAGGISGELVLMDTRSGKAKAVLKAKSKDRITIKIAFSPDGKMVASDRDGIHLWEVASRKERAVLCEHEQVSHIALSTDGRTLASSSRDEIWAWDLDRVKGKPPEDVELPSLWAALQGEDAVLAYRAIRTLTTFPSQALPLLRKSLHAAAPPPQPPMRAIERCLAELDSDDFAKREKATDELKKCGLPAVLALRGVLPSKPSLEVRRRVQAILEDIECARISQQLQQMRAVEVLEHIGTTEARGLLEELAKGVPEARLTQEVKASLARLKMRPVVKR